MPIFNQAIQAFSQGACVYVNNCEMFGYNASNQTISTTYSIIPASQLTSITIME